MTRDEDVKDVRLFDTRTVERNIKRGVITRKDYEKHLKSLADASDKVLPSEAATPADPAAPGNA
jgi:hypothetical protein